MHSCDRIQRSRILELVASRYGWKSHIRVDDAEVCNARVQRNERKKICSFFISRIIGVKLLGSFFTSFRWIPTLKNSSFASTNIPVYRLLVQGFFFNVLFKRRVKKNGKNALFDGRSDRDGRIFDDSKCRG